MYVCMHACMHAAYMPAGMYLCMHACMYIADNGRYIQIDVCR